MTLETNRLRAGLAALVILLAAALMIEAAQPAFSSAAVNPLTTKQQKAKKKQLKQCKKKKAAKKRKACAKKVNKKYAKLATKRLSGLKFYNPPAKLPAAHGKLIWQRKAGGIVPLRSASSTKLVLYTSKSTSGKTVAVSGSVSFPKGKAPKGGWPLITWGHSTTGIADQCAPSRVTASTPAGLKEGITYVDPLLNHWLNAGYAVARTDFQGLGTPGVHPYIHGVSAGRDMLDMARAARQLGPKVSKQFLIAGHSQGGHAALFAAGLASEWTPDLQLKGSAIYAPGSQFKLQAQALGAFNTPNSLTALATMLFRGLSVAYPTQLNASTMLTDPVLAFYGDTEKDCLDRLSEPDKLGGIAPANLFRAGLDTTGLYEILDAQNPVVSTDAPIMLLQGTADEATPLMLTNMLNGQLTDPALGNSVQYKTYDGLNHFDLPVVVLGEVMAFFLNQLPSGAEQI